MAVKGERGPATVAHGGFLFILLTQLAFSKSNLRALRAKKLNDRADHKLDTKSHGLGENKEEFTYIQEG